MGTFGFLFGGILGNGTLNGSMNGVWNLIRTGVAGGLKLNCVMSLDSSEL